MLLLSQGLFILSAQSFVLGLQCKVSARSVHARSFPAVNLQVSFSNIAEETLFPFFQYSLTLGKCL